MSTVVVKITNDYSDRHHSEHRVSLTAPGFLDEAPLGLQSWWEDEVYPHTGDGHGIDFDGGSCYTATIVAGPSRLLGETYEWVD